MINLDRARTKATIAWLGAPASAPIAAAAEAAGYQLTDGAAECRADIAAIDVRGARDLKAAGALIAKARRLAPSAGLIIVASSDASTAWRESLRRHADVCYARKDAAPVIAAIRERLRLAALADETGDRIKSLVAEGRSVNFTAFAHEAPPLSVLIAGKPSPLTLGACNAVRPAATQTNCVFTAGQVMRALDHSRFDAAIFLPADENDLLLALARALRRHREHRRLPVILIAENDDLLDRCAARDGFDTIRASHLVPDLSAHLQSTARRARLTSVMRNFLRSPEACGGKNGAAGARFFAHHAARVFRRADDSGQPISLVGLSVLARSTAANSAAPTALLEALRTAARLVRAEDMIAKLTSETLIIMLRGARRGEAERAAARLEGVISGTLSRSALQVTQVAAGAVEHAPGEEIERTIASLIRVLRASRGKERAAL